MESNGIKVVIQLTPEEIEDIARGTLDLAGCLTDKAGRIFRRPAAILIEESPSFMSNIIKFFSEHKTEIIAVTASSIIIGVIVFAGSKKKKEKLKRMVENFNASFAAYQEVALNGNITTYAVKNLLAAIRLLISDIGIKKFNRYFPKELFSPYLEFVRDYTVKLAEKNHVKLKLLDISELADEFGLYLLEHYLEGQERVMEIVKKRPLYPNENTPAR